MKKRIALAMVAAMALLTTACGGSDATTQETNLDASTTQEQAADNTSISGTITITGSTSVEKILVEMADEFMALNPDVTVQYTGSGSSAGIKDTIAGTNNIGASSRELKEEELAEVTETKFAIDGIAVVVNPANEVEDLTIEQVQDIYSGKITNWSEVGGKDGEIYVISREESSGTRSGFEELIGLDSDAGITLSEKASVAEGNGPVQLAVAGNENAIGYVSFAYIDETVSDVKIEGVEPTIENVKNDTYKLKRPFLFVSKEDTITDAGKAFLEFALSAEGQKAVEKHNGITIN